MHNLINIYFFILTSKIQLFGFTLCHKVIQPRNLFFTTDALNYYKVLLKV